MAVGFLYFLKPAHRLTLINFEPPAEEPTLILNAIKLRYNLLIFNQFVCVLGWGTRFFTFNKNNDLRPHP
ncbi:MAG: hypothetical protein DRR19_24305 [Candidatus Parabeggiatoa sp. nov. 1]|nr:MAG: hypothetical protein DRR19_24305 [Gammaproteobacteria bacterium]